jgi:hypothetical protein
MKINIWGESIYTLEGSVAEELNILQLIMYSIFGEVNIGEVLL